MLAETSFWVLAGALTIIAVFLYSFRLDQVHSVRTVPSSALKPTRTAFHATRLTSSTFLLREYNDIYEEHPHIYVKLIPSAQTILIIDTGCGGATLDPDIEIKSLRIYIEQVKLDCNGGVPLNEGKRMQYVVVTTHCHYDHIRASCSNDSRILVSSHAPSFISDLNLPTHSLCKNLGIKTPSYSPILVPHSYAIHSSTFVPLGVSVLHTPGHTPDELALFDAAEKMLYVGDSLYEEETIIFPKEGSIIEWLSSIEYLIAFVRTENQAGQIQINCGHRTTLRPALEVLEATRLFMGDVVSGREPVRKRMTIRGEESVEYVQKAGRFALRCPERLVLEARK
ncbi:Metallo-hydrolase/oxidoreductase [Mycena sp. CBHHK59/15]|nr:Metallo-hydrolase/oxidoreductase [Mycena sp. CBHHK59/15]